MNWVDGNESLICSVKTDGIYYFYIKRYKLIWCDSVLGSHGKVLKTHLYHFVTIQKVYLWIGNSTNYLYSQHGLIAWVKYLLHSIHIWNRILIEMKMVGTFCIVVMYTIPFSSCLFNVRIHTLYTWCSMNWFLNNDMGSWIWG